MNEFGQSLKDSSLDFAVRITRFARFLIEEKHDYVLSRQVLKSGTSIGANICEAQFAQSDADFVSKLSIALKEGAETQYWLEILKRSDFIDLVQYESLRNDCDRLVGLLVRTVKTVKQKHNLV